MPKKVDHQQRRAAMAEALWKVAAYQGLEAVSLSRVAQEAGVSKGRVQHYFPSRDALLDYTATRVQDTRDRKSTRLNSSHVAISYAVFCLKKKKEIKVDKTPIQSN